MYGRIINELSVVRFLVNISGKNYKKNTGLCSVKLQDILWDKCTVYIWEPSFFAVILQSHSLSSKILLHIAYNNDGVRPYIQAVLKVL